MVVPCLLGFGGAECEGACEDVVDPVFLDLVAIGLEGPPDDVVDFGVPFLLPRFLNVSHTALSNPSVM